MQAFLDLGEQPDPDHFPLRPEAESVARNRVEAGICRKCHLVQLLGRPTMAEEKQIGVESASSRRYAEETIPSLMELLDLPPNPTFLERHSPHGENWRAHLGRAGLAPSTTGQADLVVDVYGAMHHWDLAETLDRLVATVSGSGYLVMETQYWLTTMTNGHFDTIRNGHPVYLSLSALVPMLEARGMGVVSAAKNELHGDGLQVVARRGAPRGPSVTALLAEERAAGMLEWPFVCDLQRRANQAALDLREFLTTAKEQGRRVIGYGAPTRSIVLLNFAGITAELLPRTADMSTYKRGRTVPGTDIEIISPDDLRRERPDDVLVLTYDIAREVKDQFPDLTGTNFWLPLPRPTMVGHTAVAASC